jgi:hypothetical protein
MENRIFYLAQISANLRLVLFCLCVLRLKKPAGHGKPASGGGGRPKGGEGVDYVGAEGAVLFYFVANARAMA